MFNDTWKELLHVSFTFIYTPKDRWIGLRNLGSPNEKDETWKERKGLEQPYQFNFLPCLGVFFKIMRWTSTKKEIKKKK